MAASHSPLNVKNKLAANPSMAPKFAVEVKTADGKSIKAAEPRAVRALIALMDMQAVMGGAACHWGGPSAKN